LGLRRQTVDNDRQCRNEKEQPDALRDDDPAHVGLRIIRQRHDKTERPRQAGEQRVGSRPAAHAPVKQVASARHDGDRQRKHDEAERPARGTGQCFHRHTAADLDTQDDEGQASEIDRHGKFQPQEHDEDRRGHAAGEPRCGKIQEGEQGAAQGANAERDEDADQNRGLSDANTWR
jgi:hypothetical protein